MIISKKSTGIFQRMLNWTERVGNALPHPATLFALFALAALVFSAIGYALGWEVVHPGTDEIV
ncbi:MAG: AbgT family transporter, partial [Bacteroidales bacterium]|nr:AbgT family transporter [Bacteroidales bacterium]